MTETAALMPHHYASLVPSQFAEKRLFHAWRTPDFAMANATH
jgi:hypothetical protein